MPKPTTKYTVGQRVEHFTVDFETPGFPEIWFPATVIEVADFQPEKGRVKVAVRHDSDPDTKYRWEVVGPRGGNKHLRPLVAAPDVDFVEIGRQAFRNGDSPAPAMSQQVMDALDGRQVGDSENIRVMTDFARGWNAEHRIAMKAWERENLGFEVTQ